MKTTCKKVCPDCKDTLRIRDPNAFNDPIEGYKMASYIPCPRCCVAPQPKSEPDVTQVLAERGKRYGEFHTHAEISTAFRKIAEATPGWKNLPPFMQESLILQWHKQARILNGDPWYDNSWIDIGGYAKLVVTHIHAVQKKGDSK